MSRALKLNRNENWIYRLCDRSEMNGKETESVDDHLMATTKANELNRKSYISLVAVQIATLTFGIFLCDSIKHCWNSENRNDLLISSGFLRFSVACHIDGCLAFWKCDFSVAITLRCLRFYGFRCRATKIFSARLFTSRNVNENNRDETNKTVMLMWSTSCNDTFFANNIVCFSVCFIFGSIAIRSSQMRQLRCDRRVGSLDFVFCIKWIYDYFRTFVVVTKSIVWK